MNANPDIECLGCNIYAPMLKALQLARVVLCRACMAYMPSCLRVADDLRCLYMYMYVLACILSCKAWIQNCFEQAQAPESDAVIWASITCAFPDADYKPPDVIASTLSNVHA